MLKRIKEYIDFKGISIAAFERSIGMSNASFGKSLKSGGAIGSDKLENILKTYSDINPIWLLTGIGDMLINSNASVQVVKPEAPPNYVPECARCNDKDEIIKACRETIESLKSQLAIESKYIELLKLQEVKEKPSKEESPEYDSGQKRKVA